MFRSLDARSRLVLVRRLLALHSLVVGIGLLILPERYLDIFGFHAYHGRFFMMQGGVFHIVMAVAYVLASLRVDASPAWPMLVVTVKLTATLFLLLYFWLAEPSWMVLASAVGDAIMGAAVIVTYYQYRGGFPTPRATSKWNG